MRLDHVIFATSDLEAAAARLATEHGLAATGGGRHEGVGTHNRVIPLGPGYLQLMAVADPEEAAGSPLGRILAEAIGRRAEGWMAYCVAVDDVEAVAARLGTGIALIARQGLTARLTGVEEAMAEPFLPFFIERDPGIADPGAGGAGGGLTWVEVAGDERRLHEWTDGAQLPVRVAPGEPAVLGVGVGNRELR